MRRKFGIVINLVFEFVWKVGGCNLVRVFKCVFMVSCVGYCCFGG